MRQTQLKKQQSGFTLIELIVVIVILGILAATALPKFADLAKDARIAVLNGAKGSLASTAAMAHGKYLVATSPPLTTVLEGVTVTFTTAATTGYPKADNVSATSGLAAAAGLLGTDFVIVGGTGAIVAATANTPATTATQIAFIPSSVSGTTGGLSCYVMYTEPGAGAAPTILPTTTSC